MKSNRVVGMLVASGLILLPATAVCQASDGLDAANIFSWFLQDSADWGEGGMYALLGAVGALVTVFALIGGPVPGTAGFVRIIRAQTLLDERQEKLSELMAAQTPDAPLIAAFSEETNKLRDDIRMDRWLQFGVGSMIYVLLGAVFASALAQDLLQAIVLGAGWSGVLGTLGLKNDFAERQSIKNKNIDQTVQMVGVLSKAIPSGKTPVDVPDLLKKLRVARAV